jgi:arsenate reductase (glutaredoxin)
MTVQIIGAKNCADTRKAERFFKERSVEIHLRDLAVAPPSRGELEKATARIPAGELLDPASPAWKNGGYAYREFEALEELLENPRLLKTPLVRWGAECTVGYAPESWSAWIARARRSERCSHFIE